MKDNKKTIIALAIITIFGFSLASGLIFYIFIGSYNFFFYTIFVGIIFACIQQYKNFYQYLIKNFISSFIFSSFCTFGVRFSLIYKKMFPIDQYTTIHFKTDFEITVFLALIFLISTFIGIPIKIFLIKHKEWFFTYKR